MRSMNLTGMLNLKKISNPYNLPSPYDHWKDGHLQYLQDVVDIVAQFEWIYNFKVVDFFKERIWEKIPEEWQQPLLQLSYEDLKYIPQGRVKEFWPESLQNFIAKVAALAMPREPNQNIDKAEIQDDIGLGMIPKKRHEVESMASFIAKMCENYGCETVVDIGSGLGYLGQVLNSLYKMKIVGLDSNSQRSESAITRNVKVISKRNASLSTWNGSRPQDINSITLRISGDTQSYQELTRLVEDLSINHTNNSKGLYCPIGVNKKSTRDDNCEAVASFPNQNQENLTIPICFAGLHCCNDLTPNILHYVGEHCPFSALLVCVGCCYHGMTTPLPERQDTKANSCFKNFPMSFHLNDILSQMSKKYHDWQMGIYAMRLAAQETRKRWEKMSLAQHVLHTKNVAYRSIVNEALPREIRETNQGRVRIKVSAAMTFEDYTKIYLNRIQAVTDENYEKCFATCMQKYKEHELVIPYAEAITALQVLFQPLLESIVTIDRCLYLNELNIDCGIIPLFEEYISPRNLAIVGMKII
ncbi:Protein RRNAD1 [Trichoplax sp. H2]|nr:Protein RRNAD1 [Trichoplax sp. H2]|eukprot:RDD47557.1 Protein RRNAD1 [Trichoplax sp. H2]